MFDTDKWLRLVERWRTQGTIPPEDVDWLIAQAEKVPALEAEVASTAAECRALRELDTKNAVESMALKRRVAELETDYTDAREARDNAVREFGRKDARIAELERHQSHLLECLGRDRAEAQDDHIADLEAEVARAGLEPDD